MSASHETGARGGANLPGGQGPRRSRKVVVGAVAASLLSVGGVAALAGQRLLSPGTSQDGQPSAVLPGDAVAYYRVDFDPSTAQKVAAFRLFDKLPEAKQALGDGNPKRALFELFKKHNQQLKDVDYANDIDPWLGDRVGLAVLAPRDGEESPMIVAAVQVKDEAKANEGIERLKQKTGADLAKLTEAAKNTASPGALTFGVNRGYADYVTSESSTSPGGTGEETASWSREGYLLLTRKSDEQAVRAAIDKGRLADNEAFTKDMSDLGEQGVLSGWTDTPRYFEAMSKTGPGLTASMLSRVGLAGRQASALRFDAGYVEMASLTRDTGLNIDHPALRDIGKLPTDTVAFASGTGGADVLRAIWPKIEKAAKEANPSVASNWDQQLRQIKDQTGIALPEDLETLLGKQFDLVVSEKSVKNESPVLGARLLTDPAKAEGVLANLDKLLNQSAGGNAAAGTLRLHRKTEGDVVYVGSTQSYLDELAGGGSLGDDPTLKEAAPNLDKASGGLFVNVDKIEGLYLTGMPEGQQKDMLAAAKAIGMSTVKNGDRYDSITRLLVN